jgi:uncharacterized protein YjbI with pentapeptide repeats
MTLASHCDLDNLYLVGADFTGLDLSGAYLAFEDLTRIRAVGTDFRDANLRDAVLDGAVLADADFRGADLSGASLVGAELDGVLIDDDTLWPLDQARPNR